MVFKTNGTVVITSKNPKSPVVPPAFFPALRSGETGQWESSRDKLTVTTTDANGQPHRVKLTFAPGKTGTGVNALDIENPEKKELWILEEVPAQPER